MLIVIALVGVMAVGLVVILNPLTQIQKAQDAKRKGDISNIQSALETYYQDNNAYPASTADYKIIGLDGATVSWGTPWQPYMSTLPNDPSSSKRYVYRSTGNGQTYYIYASMDRETATLSNLPGDANCGSDAVAITCNYGVSSSNVSP